VVDAGAQPIRPLPYSAYGETDANLMCTRKGAATAKI